MRRPKYNEANVPDSLFVRVRYTRTKERGPWFTHCQLIDNKTDGVVAFGVARTSPKDQANRKIGRAIAVGRALKNFHEGVPCLS